MSRQSFWWGLSMAIAMGGWAAPMPAATWQDEQKQDKVDVTALLERGQELIGGENFKEAAKVLRQVVEADDKNGLGWQLLGYALHASGDLEAAIPAHQRAAEFKEFKPIALYNLGCAWSLKKDADQSFKFMDEAVAAGFVDSSYFETDSDLDFIRKDPRFDRLVKKVKNGGKDPALTPADLKGSWKYTSGKRAGEEVAADRLAMGGVTFAEDKLTIPAGPDNEFVMSYKLKAGKKFTEIDLSIESGPAPEGKALGILKWENDELTLCYDPLGANRPTAFESTAENGFFMFVMKKEKAAEKTDK